LIIASSEYIRSEELNEMSPVVLVMGPDNAIDEALRYEVTRADGRFAFNARRME